MNESEDPSGLKVTADAMEGIIGAVYLDSGVQQTLQMCTRLGLIPSTKILGSAAERTENAEEVQLHEEPIEADGRETSDEGEEVLA